MLSIFDAIITVTLNPSIDATVWVQKLDFEEPTKCLRKKDYSGGKGINVSKTLKALQIDNHAILVVGKGNADKLKDLLDEDSVDYCIIENDGAVRENLAIIFPGGEKGENGEKQKLLKINFPGFDLSTQVLLEVKNSVLKACAGKRSPLLVFAGSLPNGIDAAGYKKLIIACKNGVNGAQVVLDNDLFSLEDLKEISPLLIKPNHVELAHIFGNETVAPFDVSKHGQELAEFIPHVLISMGEKGLHYYSNGQKLTARVPIVDVKSTIGAGDSTLAGFIAAFAAKAEIRQALKFAAACGTAAVTLEGTETISRKLAEEIFETVEIF